MMQLKDIINYLDYLDQVKIYQGDTYKNPAEQEDPWECIFSGSVMDVPWIYLDYYLTNTPDFQAIYCAKDENNDVYQTIFVCEDLKFVEKYNKGEI